MGDGSFKFIFESGVVRFDASDNLFVHLRHSKTDAHPLTIDDGVVSGLPETQRRGRFLGAGAGSASGSFKTTDDLIRGFTIEVKGYTSAAINGDGHLEVDVEGVVDGPDWASGTTLRLGRDGDALRLWSKSSFPAGVTEGDGTAPAPKPKAKKGKGPGPKKPPAEPAKTFNGPEKTEAAETPAPKKKAAPKKAAPKKAAAKKAAAKKKAPAKKAAAKKAPAEKAAPKEAAPEAEAPAAAEKPKTESMAKARGDKLPGKQVKVGATGVKAEGGKSKTTVETTPRTAGSKAHDPGGKKASGDSGGGCALLGGVMLLSIFAALTSLAAII